MLDINDVIGFLNENFSNIKSSKNNTHWLFRCPFCGDSKQSMKKRRFNVDWNNGNVGFHCFNCSISGNFFDLYAHVKNITPEEAFKIFHSYNEDYIKKSFKNNTNNKKENEISKKYFNFNDFLKNYCIHENSKPNSFKQEQYIKTILEFKEKRQIDYPIFYCFKGDFFNRLIIPVFLNNKCIFFQGRAIFAEQNPKYLNPIVEKENIILNLDNFNENEYIIITEGFLDALSIGNQGTSCIGAEIKDVFIKELFKYTNKGVIIALDGDERGISSTQKILKNSKFNKKLYYFFIEDFKDLNELKVKKSLNEDEIYNFIINNKKTYFESQITINMF